MLVFPVKRVIIPKSVLPILKEERSFLDRTGIKIFSAASNEEALALHKRERADLIVAVLNDTGMDGIELCAVIRDDSELRKVSIVIICGDTEADHERCLGCSANSFVTSPINMAVFLQEAHQLLNVARRTSFRSPVDLEININSGGEKFGGHSINISSSGMLIETDAALNEGDSIACTFSLPEAGDMAVDATVVRVEEGNKGNPSRYGVSFVEPGEDFVTAVALFAKKQS